MSKKVILFSILIVSLVCQIILYFCVFHQTFEPYSVGHNIALIAIYMTYMQLKVNNEWNKRSFALKALHEDRQGCVDAVRRLRASIDYDSKKVFTSQEILASNKEDGNVIIDIGTVLNSYEYFAVGIQHKTFDEKIVKNLLEEPWINAYTAFSDYIGYVRSSSKVNAKDAFKEMEAIAKQWIREKEEKRKTRDEII